MMHSMHYVDSGFEGAQSVGEDQTAQGRLQGDKTAHLVKRTPTGELLTVSRGGRCCDLHGSS
jgi:hypothetical protein